MGVINWTEDPRGASATIVAEPSSNMQTGSTTRIFMLQTNGVEPAPQEILMVRDYQSLPNIRDAHPYDPWLFVVRKTATPVDNARLTWRVTVEYDFVDDPLSQDPIVNFDFATSSEPIDVDQDGKVIANSADERYDPPVQRDWADLIIRITRNESVFNEELAQEFKDAVNSTAWRGHPTGTARLVVFKGDQKRSGGITYYEVNYEIQTRKDGWLKKPLDEGFRIKTGTDSAGKPKYQQLTDDDGTVLTEPVKLDGNGAKLAEGADPVKMSYRVYPVKDFSQLGI